MHIYGRRSVFPILTGAMISLAPGAGIAHAQDVTAAQQGQDRPSAGEERPAQRGGDHFIVGTGAAYAPTYQGSDDHRVLPVPAIDVAWGPLFANLRNGIGIAPISTDAVTVGVGATYMPGYRSKDVPAGVGNLSVGLGARAFASIREGGLIGTIGATKGVAGGNKGFIADASISYPIGVTPRLMLVPTLGTSWTNDKYNQRYFGISPEQSAASGLAAFRPGSGLKDASAILTGSYRLTDRLMLGVSGGVTKLMGDVEDSPLVHQDTQPFGFFSLSYRLGR